MNGNIVGRDVLAHSFQVLRDFGVRCYWCCVKATLLMQHKTFLDCAYPLKVEATRDERGLGGDAQP